MRILIVSRTPWRLDNSFGNTYSNLFSKIKNIEIAHIYLADGSPEKENVVTSYYKVSESQILRSFFKLRSRENSVGEIVLPSQKTELELHSSVVSARKKRWPIFFLIRDFIWRYGNVNYSGMIDFAKSFSPDLIFAPLYNAKYVSRVIIQLQQVLNVPIVLECSLDVYTFKQISFDPFFWINRITIRHTIRNILKRTSLLYVISDKMLNDYVKLFNIPCKILYKFPDLSRTMNAYQVKGGVKTKFLFTGNIGDGRWLSLSRLAEVLCRNNYGRLDIYTATPLTPDMRNVLEIPNVCSIHAPVSQETVIKLQGEADVLVHVESFKLKNKLNVRYSISTKIMDYLCAGRTILAIGPSDIASMEYLRNNHLALCANSIEELDEIIRVIINDHEILNEMAPKGLRFVQTNLDVNRMRSELFNDLKTIADNGFGKLCEEK